MKPIKARPGDEWIIAEFRFRRPAIGPFPTEAMAREYMAERLDNSQGWNVIPLRTDEHVIAIVCRYFLPDGPPIDFGEAEDDR